jgi:tRNA pseudouridine55 synthase
LLIIQMAFFMTEFLRGLQISMLLDRSPTFQDDRERMINAVLVIDKPAGFTSHDVVNRVRRIMGERSVGHLGTLDPMATGVLPLVLGRFTRLAQFFQDSSKVYEGEIRFGFATDTYDAEGEPVGPVVTTGPTLEEVRRHLPTGRILQTPPAYSAKKINGVAAYKLARQDKPVEMKAVEVEIHRFEIQSVWGDRARFVAEVSAGTYIRSLAHDLGQALGCGAHLSELRRTRAGEFELSQAVTLDELANLPSIEIPSESSAWVHPRSILRGLPCVTGSPDVISYLGNGRAVNLPEFSDAPLVKVFANQTDLFAIVQRVAGTLFRPKVVIG